MLLTESSPLSRNVCAARHSKNRGGSASLCLVFNAFRNDGVAAWKSRRFQKFAQRLGLTDDRPPIL